MKIGNTEDMSSTISQLNQGVQNLRNQNTAVSDQNNSFSTVQMRGDLLEISEVAYDALSKESGTMGGMMPPPPPDASQALSGLVDDGTITSEQADAVSSALSSTEVEVSEGSNPLKTVLDSLVEAGTITNDQADSIASAMTPPPPPPPMGMGMSMGVGGPGGADSEEGSGSGSEDTLTTGVSDTASAAADASETSDDTDGLIKNIVNTLLSNGTNSKGSISSLLSLLNSLDTDTLETIYSDLSGATNSPSES